MKSVLIPNNLQKKQEISLFGFIGEKYVLVTNGLKSQASTEIGYFAPAGDELSINMS